ncbi:uncharacterized protein LOC133923052 [Phragmites australis]|uniref:uncharacterized protein LOC133923052 n=1 Tax=Phragmites australis TaxID=29695 RepID=UPI002D766556|nr:uncharacterized protein LOC133923052 [Phragmites australis]
MKPQRQLSMEKLSNAAKDLLIFMPRKKLPTLGVGSAVVAKCRELWEGCTGCGSGVARDDYFSGSYEFSCTTTPVVPVKGRGRRCRQRRLPPCVGGRQAREMLASVVPGRGWSPERSPETRVGHEIDGLAEEFIKRFHDELRKQRVAELKVEHERSAHLALSVPVM